MTTNLSETLAELLGQEPYIEYQDIILASLKQVRRKTIEECAGVAGQNCWSPDRCGTTTGLCCPCGTAKAIRSLNGS